MATSVRAQYKEACHLRRLQRLYWGEWRKYHSNLMKDMIGDLIVDISLKFESMPEGIASAVFYGWESE